MSDQSTHIKYTSYTTIGTVMTAALNEGNFIDQAEVYSDFIDNTSDMHFRDDLELYISFDPVSSMVSNPVVECYLFWSESSDGNYADGDNFFTANEAIFCGLFAIRRELGPQRVVLPHVALPPAQFKYMLRNSVGTGSVGLENTLRRRSYSYKGQGGIAGDGTYVDDTLYLYAAHNRR